MTFVHVGTFVELPSGKELNNFGETLELSQAEGDAFILNDVPFLPLDVFNKAGFTADELKQYPNVGMHDLGGPAIVAKRKKAWDLLHDYRENLRNPAPAPPPAAPKKPAVRGEKEGD